MGFNFKQLLARGPERIEAEAVRIKEVPIEELGLTLLYIAVAGIWVVFADDVFNLLMGIKVDSPALQTLKGINFITTTAIVLYIVLRRTLRNRRLAQEALRLTQERFEFVALATTDAIWDLNLLTKVVWWSDGVQKLFGYQAADVSSNFDWWVQRLHPNDRERVLDSIRAAVDSGRRSWAGEYRFRRQDNTYATVLDRGCIIQDATGKPLRLVCGMSDVSERRTAEQALERSRQQLRALTARLQAGREEERATVAREIHDDLGQTLTALKLNLDWLEKQVGRPGSEAQLLLERVVESAEMVDTATQSVQRIATNLRPPVLDNLGLLEALREEAARFQERSGITCEARLPANPLALRPEAAIAVFRVFQEALTNVVRHAQASAVSVSLEKNDGHVQLQVEDNGRGIALESIGDPHSLGLLGMTERALALGGHVDVMPTQPHGTRVTLRLPASASP
jgi:two-component system, NarL family, sensor histidine kinase UhpB